MFLADGTEVVVGMRVIKNDDAEIGQYADYMVSGEVMGINADDYYQINVKFDEVDPNNWGVEAGKIYPCTPERFQIAPMPPTLFTEADFMTLLGGGEAL